ncbi:MAG: hypothetical protein Q8L60_12745 [Gammaproteobacteria bacterium]|nr:hypothetical protein [Anaerolineales bacterium]MDP1932315.1 hypothetical protein [Gammaproteobacteria bacterium]
MKFSTFSTRSVLVLLVTGLLMPSQLMAANAGNGNQDNDKIDNKSERNHSGNHFGDHQKIAVRDYFREESRQGRCPPGLAKKNNGCIPPGQVKRWQMGQPLKQEVTYRSLPVALVNLLGRPQPGYHYGMVDSDILLLLDGTEIVFDAIMSLGQ